MYVTPTIKTEVLCLITQVQMLLKRQLQWINNILYSGSLLLLG